MSDHRQVARNFGDIKPVSEKQRIEQLDVLRGIAVLGIFVMNVQAFAMPAILYIDPLAMGEINSGEYAAWYLTQVLANTKFMAIFTVLFGAGLAMMAAKAKAAHRSTSGIQYRRLAWLLVIGLLHAYFLFYGDVLVSYALLGMLVWLLVGLPIPAMLAIACACMGIWFLQTFSFTHFMESEMAEKGVDLWQMSPEAIEREMSLRSGSFADQLNWRIPTAIKVQIWWTLLMTGLKTISLMLIGAVLLRWSLLRGGHRATEWAMLIGGLVLGLPLVIVGIELFESTTNTPLGVGLIECMKEAGNLALAAAWIGGVLLLCRSESLRWLRTILAPVGRMALTAYIFESVIAGWIFYGHGLGWVGQVSRVEQFYIVVVVWIGLLVGCSLWLSWFRFGPLEWIWRMLTYWRFEAIRRGD